ncbi:MAG TPA: EamA family transporter [Patescibacteria group bacterium]|nr:EamA family transporter [Patescibacteria group bacterium]
MICYSIAVVLISMASRHTDTNLVVAITNILGALVPLIIVIPILNKQLFINGKFGIVLSLLAGICIAVFSVFFSKSLSVNKVGIVTPLIFGGMIFLSAILSSIFLKEKVSFFQGIGLALLGIGLLFIIYAKAAGK